MRVIVFAEADHRSRNLIRVEESLVSTGKSGSPPSQSKCHRGAPISANSPLEWIQAAVGGRFVISKETVTIMPTRIALCPHFSCSLRHCLIVLAFLRVIKHLVLRARTEASPRP